MDDKIQGFSREIDFDRELKGLVDLDKREVEVSFSSETDSVIRWFPDGKGREVLSHNEGAVDLRRLRKVGSFLFGHTREIIGPIKKVWIDGDRGCAKVGFDETDDGNKRMIQVNSGSLKGMSFHYRVKRFRKLEPGEKYQLKRGEIIGGRDMPTYIAERWEPTEISALPDPYDDDVGIGRSLKGIEIVGIMNNKERSNDMGDENKGLTAEQVRGMITEVLKNFMPDLTKTIAEQVRSAIEEESRPKIRVDATTQKDLYGRARAISPDVSNGLMDKMFAGENEAQLLRYLNDEMVKNPDANHVEGGGDGTQRGKKKDEENQNVRSFEQVEDDAFFSSLKSPSMVI